MQRAAKSNTGTSISFCHRASHPSGLWRAITQSFTARNDRGYTHECLACECLAISRPLPHSDAATTTDTGTDTHFSISNLQSPISLISAPSDLHSVNHGRMLCAAFLLARWFTRVVSG